MKTRQAYNKINKDELLKDILKIYHNKGDNKFTQQYYLQNGKYSKSPIKTNGGWNTLLNELGIELNLNRNVTKQNVIDDFYRVKEEQGIISSTIFRKHGKYSQKIIDDLFGGYSKLLEYIGINSKYVARITTNEEIINNLRRVYDKYGYINSTLISTKTPYSHQTIINRFGSMSSFYESMNIDNNVNNKCYFKSADYVIDIFKDILNETPIREWTCCDLVNPEKTSHLYVDAYFPQHNLVVEYNGQQHYEYVEFLHKTYDKFLRTQLLDRHKENILNSKNIKLIKFKYSEPKNKKYIEEILKTIKITKS